MSERASPKWVLSPEWGVSTDPYNWILYRRRGKRWDAVAFYPSPELLLKSLYRKMLRTEPANPDLVMHVEVISRCVEGWAARFYEQINTQAGGRAELKVAAPVTERMEQSAK